MFRPFAGVLAGARVHMRGMRTKLAYGDPGHPGFAATLIRSAIHRKLVIYRLLDIIIAT
jgi:hypothetical protein